MPRLSKKATASINEAVLDDMSAVLAELQDRFHKPGVEEAWVGIETFVAIAMRVFADVNPSKLKEHMRIVEIQARMDGKQVFE